MYITDCNIHDIGMHLIFHNFFFQLIELNVQKVCIEPKAFYFLEINFQFLL